MGSLILPKLVRCDMVSVVGSSGLGGGFAGNVISVTRDTESPPQHSGLMNAAEGGKTDAREVRTQNGKSEGMAVVPRLTPRRE